MNILSDWLAHRAHLVGLSWPEGMAEASGVAQATLDSILSTEDLRHVARSARGYIARALKVSVRDLEALSQGDIAWIADNRVVDLDRLTPNSGSASEADMPVAVLCERGHGIPILGKILKTGIAEHGAPWSPEEGPRLGVRFPRVPDAFALALAVDVPPHRARTCLAWQVIPPAECRAGELALLTLGQDETDAELFVVHGHGPMSLSVLRVGLFEIKPMVISTGEILRAARVIGTFDQSGGS